MANTTDFKARVEYEVTDGTQTTYTFPFSYLRKKFVMVSILHSDATETVLEYGVDYTVNNLSVSLTAPAQVGEHIIIYRQTSTDKIVTWNDGSILLARDMNTEDAQMLHLQEEQQDYIRANAINAKVTSDKEVIWDARNHRVSNVSDPKDPQDAINKNYMETVQGGFVVANTKILNDAKATLSATQQIQSKAQANETLSKSWATSTESPDGEVDTDSTTGKTQSAKEWALSSKRYLEDANSAFDGLLTENEWLGDMLGYGVAKGCRPSLTNNTIHIDPGVIVAKTGNKHRISAQDFELIEADDTPRYDVIVVDVNGNVSYSKGNPTYIQAPQAGEATYQMLTQPIVGNWMIFGSIYGAPLKPTADSNVAGNNGYFLVGSTIADTVKNLVNVFNSISTLSDKWAAYTVEGESDKFMVREKVAGGNTPRNFMKATNVPAPIIQLSMTRSVQKVISSPTISNTSIPLCTIRIEKNNKPVLSDSRSITPNISPNIANVRAYGAVGDGVFDDSFAIQKAFDTGKSVYFPAGTYRIDTMITRTRNDNIVIDASNAHILYTGTEYAFKLGSNNYSVFRFNDIIALNGGGIWLCGDQYNRYSSYTDIWFKEIAVETNGVYVTSTDWPWMNENYLHYGTFTRGDNGFYYFHNSRNGTSRWIFDHVSVEGVQRGFNLKQGDYAKKNNKWFTDFEFNNGRYAENDNFITVDGKATNFLIVSSSPVEDKNLECTKECTGWVFISRGDPLGKLANGRYFRGGVYRITRNDTDLLDLNNLTITGKYVVGSYAEAKLMKNSPITDMPFSVIVQEASGDDLDYNSNALTQIIYDWENRRKYTRMYTKSSATWTEWESARDITRDVSSQIKPLISDITLSGVNGKYRNGVITIQCTVNVTKIVPSGTKIINIPTSKNMILGWMLDNKNKTSIPWISSENKDIQAQTDLEMGNTYTIYITYVANDSY